MELLTLQGRSAIVTGGARGIGHAITLLLQQQGASVHVFDIAEPAAPVPGAHYQVLDLSDAEAVTGTIAALPDDTTLLVNNAGITRDRTLARMSDEQWQAVIDINLSAAFYTLRAMAEKMKAAGAGRVVNITSINGMRGKFGQGNYAAAKAGLIGLTKTAARELGPKGITVNAVAPGMVMTEMAEQLPPAIIDQARAESALQQLTPPEAIANAVLFLLSDAAAFITGEVLRVDAGQYI